MCSAFLLDEGEVSVLLAESADKKGSAFARIASLRYAQHYWSRDTAMLSNLGRAHSHILTARRADISIRDIDYRLECYGEGEVSERISICKSGSPGFVINAYRLKVNGPFPPDDFDIVSQISPALLAAVEKHQMIIRDHRSSFPSPTQLAIALRKLGTKKLSFREAQILALLATGYSEPKAAEQLSLGLTSITTYRKRAYAKLGLHNQQELRAAAYEALNSSL